MFLARTRQVTRVHSPSAPHAASCPYRCPSVTADHPKRPIHACTPNLAPVPGRTVFNCRPARCGILEVLAVLFSAAMPVGVRSLLSASALAASALAAAVDADARSPVQPDACKVIAAKLPFVPPEEALACLRSFPFNETVRKNVRMRSSCVSRADARRCLRTRTASWTSIPSSLTTSTLPRLSRHALALSSSAHAADGHATGIDDQHPRRACAHVDSALCDGLRFQVRMWRGAAPRAR